LVRWQHMILLMGLLFLSSYAKKAKDYEDDDWEALEKEHGLDQHDHISVEHMQGLHKAFDTNGDGKATQDEINKYAETMRGIMATKDSLAGMAELDENSDGKLSLEEAISPTKKQLAKAKTDEDKKEAQTQIEHETEKFHAVDISGDGHLQIEEVHGMLYPETNDKALEVAIKYELRHYDRDGDGKLSLKEYLSMPGVEDDGGEEREQFKLHDVDGNGLLDRTELVGKEGGRMKLNWAVEHLVNIADVNKDGGVTADELANVRKVVMKHDTLGWNMLEWIEHEEL